MVKALCIEFDDNKVPYIDLGTGIIRMEKEEAPEWALEKAREELRELPEIMEPAIKKLRELIEEEKHLKLPLDDEYMKMFLRPCHYYPESAIKRKNGNPLVPPLIDLFRTIQLTVLGSMAEPLSQICGAIVIIDMEGLPMSHVMQFTPSFAAMLLDYVQECICMRLKAVHIVNNSYIFNMLFAIFKPFIREKLRKRIFFHGKDWKSLTSHIDKNSLPVKYGGTGTWELPSGKLLGDFFECYSADYELADTYGFTEDYKMKSSAVL